MKKHQKIQRFIWILINTKSLDAFFCLLGFYNFRRKFGESTFCSNVVQNSSSPSIQMQKKQDSCRLAWTFTAIHSTIYICIKYEVQDRQSHFYLKISYLVLVWFLFFKYPILFKTLCKRNCIWLLSVEYVTYKLMYLRFCQRSRVSKHIHQEKEERNRKVLWVFLNYTLKLFLSEDLLKREENPLKF